MNGHEPELETPGAGPSRPASPNYRTNQYAEDQDARDEEEDRQFFLKRRKEYLELEQSIKSSDELLSSLSSYLSTFQNDLSAVSGKVADLQGRSSHIESQLQGRKAVLPPLNDLLGDITLPPSLVLALRDTQPAQNPDLWLQAIVQLEEKMAALKARPGVKATAEMEGVIEGLRLKALTQLPPFLLSLIRPLKSASKGLSTNLAVLQTSLLLKYQPFYAFLLRQSPKIAKQVERGYVNAARAYYETGMRRYARALAQIRARTVEKAVPLGVVVPDAQATNAPKGAIGTSAQRQAYDRLQYADLNVEGEAGQLILAYMADDKDLRLPVEALFRSLSLVLLDNASAEFTFIVRFFARAGQSRPRQPSSSDPLASSRQETPLDSPTDGVSEIGRSRAGTPAAANTKRRGGVEVDDTMKNAERIWHEVFSSALEYCSEFFNAILNPSPPPAVVVLTLIRLNDHLIETSDSRAVLPLNPFFLAQKMALWPVYRKEMDRHFDSLKKLADDAEGKGLAGYVGKGVKDGTVRTVASRYAALFSCVTALSGEAEEAMIFSSMTRLRGELVRLLQAQSAKIKNPSERHSFLSSIYEIVMRELVAGPGQTTHPRLQSELSFFRTREEEARRRIAA